jgi:hypothetical protein
MYVLRVAHVPQSVENVVGRQSLSVSSWMAKLRKKDDAASFYPAVNKADYFRL